MDRRCAQQAKVLGDRVRTHRKKAKLSQEDLGEVFGLP